MTGDSDKLRVLLYDIRHIFLSHQISLQKKTMFCGIGSICLSWETQLHVELSLGLFGCFVLLVSTGVLI